LIRKEDGRIRIEKKLRPPGADAEEAARAASSVSNVCCGANDRSATIGQLGQRRRDERDW
jgi:hypothetical protein